MNAESAYDFVRRISATVTVSGELLPIQKTQCQTIPHLRTPLYFNCWCSWLLIWMFAFACGRAMVVCWAPPWALLLDKNNPSRSRRVCGLNYKTKTTQTIWVPVKEWLHPCIWLVFPSLSVFFSPCYCYCCWISFRFYFLLLLVLVAEITDLEFLSVMLFLCTLYAFSHEMLQLCTAHSTN